MMESTPTLSLSEAFSAFTSKIFKFDGRARRSEFWWIMLLVFGVTLVLPSVGWVFNLLTIPLTFRRLHDTGRSGWWWGAGAVLQAVVFVFLLRNLVFMMTAVEGLFMSMVNYMMDYLVVCVAIMIYQIVLLVFYCQDSEPCDNKYGLSPKYVGEREGDDVVIP